MLSLPAPVKADGWYFVTATNNTEVDPTAFELQGSDDGRHWERVAPAGSRWAETGEVKPAAAAFPTPIARLQETWMDLTRPWYCKVCES